MQSDRRRLMWFALFVAVAILGVLYVNGSLDPLLYRFGLNHFPCTHTLAGSTLCGANVAGTPY